MHLYRDEGVVLRTQKLGEADRIVTLLTREHGRVRAVAKGVRRTTSKFGARLEPFTHVDVQLYAGRRARRGDPGRDAGPTAPRSSDYARYTAGTAMLETAERLTDRGARAGRAAVPAARRRAAHPRRGASTSPAWCSTPSCCARSRSPATRPASTTAPGAGRGPAPAVLGARAAGRCCGDCRAPGGGVPVPETVGAARCAAHRRLGDGRRARAAARREASGLVAAYLQWHLERGLRSLPLVERELGCVGADRGSRRGAATSRPPEPHPSGARPPEIPRELVPRHVAIVMDGNGRWANQRGLPRTEGHERGEAGALRRASRARSRSASVALGVRLLHRELAPLARRGPLPDGLQPRRDPAPPRPARTSWASGCRWAGRRPRLWRSRDQRARGRRGADRGQRRADAARCA